MNRALFKKIAKMWLLLTFLAVINGIIRNGVYGPLVEELAAHQISSIIFIAVIFAATYLFLSRESFISGRELMEIGALWFLATVIFEFVFGHYVFGNSWERLLTDYNIFTGRIWMLVLLAILTAPYLVGKYLNRKKKI